VSGSTCTCGATFRTGEDYRDHMPCPGTGEEQETQRIAALLKQVTDAADDVQKKFVQLQIEFKALAPLLEIRNKQLALAVSALRNTVGNVEDLREAKSTLEAMEKLERDFVIANQPS